ncbi:MAG: GGDEF domain-containing protein [Rhodocyclaceae bacterium]
MKTPLLHLLNRLEAVTGSRERDRMATVVVESVRELLGARVVLMHGLSITAQGYATLPIAWATTDTVSACDDVASLDFEKALRADALMEECLASAEGMASELTVSHLRQMFSVGAPCSASALVEAQCDLTPSDEAVSCVRKLLQIYAHQLSLLDYAELDTLTRLHSRKTFDANFDRFIAIAGEAQQRLDPDRRLHEEQAFPCWLGVVDIDRFKRINDNFGHLFGDEVLLRVAELMKKSFRTSDKLFRFGGEEFVILLRHVSPQNAREVLDRFRIAVEAHEFPQVGQVTCSMGYVQINPQLTPAELLGKADAALYFSKGHGRNQINQYEQLVDQGLVDDKIEAATANAGLQADIDALFG